MPTMNMTNKDTSSLEYRIVLARVLARRPQANESQEEVAELNRLRTLFFTDRTQFVRAYNAELADDAKFIEAIDEMRRGIPPIRPNPEDCIAALSAYADLCEKMAVEKIQTAPVAGATPGPVGYVLSDLGRKQHKGKIVPTQDELDLWNEFMHKLGQATDNERKQIHKEIGAVLKTSREEHGLTRTCIAVNGGVANRTVTKVEDGILDFSSMGMKQKMAWLKIFIKIAKVTNTRLNKFLQIDSVE